MVTFDDLVFRPHPRALSDTDVQARVALSNGVRVSVIRTGYSYGNENGEGLYEACVLTDDDLEPVGWLTESGVTAFLAEVEARRPATEEACGA